MLGVISIVGNVSVYDTVFGLKARVLLNAYFGQWCEPFIFLGKELSYGFPCIALVFASKNMYASIYISFEDKRVGLLREFVFAIPFEKYLLYILLMRFSATRKTST